MMNCDPSLSTVFLSGEMDEHTECEFAEHLEVCPACRARLESDSAPQSDWCMAAELKFHEEHDSSLDVLKTDELARAAKVIAEHLAPSDDPAMMGRLGAYEVIGVVGHGAMGVVLKAIDRALNRTVAIKILHPTLARFETARERFAREARGMASISHEHVVPIFAVDELGDLPYFVMEYVASGTLESRIRRDSTLDIISTVRIALQVAEALSAAHAQGLVHRDIKPANILLDEGTERVRVADFGLALINTDATLTQTGVVTGTPQYMAPEQIRGDACDARSDLFSLGALMFAMLTGQSPFGAENVYATMQRIVHEEMPNLRNVSPDVPNWMEQLIKRLLEKQAENRLETAHQVANILQGELAHLQNPVEKPRPTRDWHVSHPSNSLRLGIAVVIAFAVLSSVIVLRPLLRNADRDGDQIEQLGKANSHTQVLRKSRLVGTVVDGLEFEDILGTKTNLVDLRGRFVVLGFWATWCKQVEPQLVELERIRASRDQLDVIGVNCDSDKPDVTRFLQNHALPWRHILVGGVKGEIPTRFGVSSLPTYIVVGPDGTVISQSSSLEDLASLLKEKN